MGDALAWIHVGFMLASVALVAAVLRHLRGRPFLDRLIAAVAPPAFAFAAWHAAFRVLVHPMISPWSGARLAASVALSRGLPLYYPPASGPVLSWIYPPLGSIAYLPAALAAEPAHAVLAGRCLTLVYYYGPAAWVLLSGREAGRTIPKPIRWLTLATFALVTTGSQPLNYVSTEIHVDAPALAFGTIAVGVMGRSRGAADLSAVALAAALGALSVWSKQVAAPVLLVLLPLWALATAGGRGAFLRSALMGCLTAGAVSLPFLLLTHRKAMLFNILTVPGHHPFRFGSPYALLVNVAPLFGSHLPLITWLTLAAVASRSPRARPGPLPNFASRGPALAPWLLLAALVETPMALLGYAKLGGDYNALAYSLHFLVLGALRALGAQLTAEAEPSPPDSPGRRPRLALAVAAVGLAVVITGEPELVRYLASGQRSWQAGRQVADFLRRHPGEAYFPWYPLEHLVVEGRVSHFEYGVYDRDIAGYPLSEAHFRAHVPPSARLVCYPPPWATEGPRVTLRYLTDFRLGVEPAELPGWDCFERVAPAGRAGGDGGNTRGAP